MELIIKPTEKCNFACLFCSSSNLVNDKEMTLPHEQIFKFLDRFPNTSTIIVNGGDPLMVAPEYYYKIIDYLDTKKLSTTISFTTNLWDFYNNPGKWEGLFKHKRMGVSTSFQYGVKRRIDKKTVFTEETFVSVMEFFNSKIGYYPSFIAVVDDYNIEDSVKTVELAKRFNVVCKLNYAAASGRQNRPFPLSKIYKEYLKIYKLGLHPWEYNTTQIFVTKQRTCPVSRSCDSGIRAMNPDGAYFSCGSFADDKKYPIDFDAEMKDKTKVALPLASAVELISLKDECLTCPLFMLCNGCKKHIHDLKQSNMVEEHCTMMKAQSHEILEALNGSTN